MGTPLAAGEETERDNAGGRPIAATRKRAARIRIDRTPFRARPDRLLAVKTAGVTRSGMFGVSRGARTVTSGACIPAGWANGARGTCAAAGIAVAVVVGACCVIVRLASCRHHGQLRSGPG